MPLSVSQMRWPIALGVTMLGALSVAAAQTGGANPAPWATVQAPREVELTPEQELAAAELYIARMGQGAVSVRAMLEQARAARDVVKTLCLNDKVNQIDVASRSSADRMTSLRTAAQAKDADRAKHEFTVMQVLRDRVEQLLKEANQCIGEEAGFVGESQVTLQIDPNIPQNNPDKLGNDPQIVSEPPVVSSPTL